MKTFRMRFDRILQSTIAGLLAVMVLNVVWQVFTRFVLQSPSAYTEELARYTMIWLALLGAAYCVGRRSHLALDLVPGLLKGNSKKRLGIMIHVMVLGFALAILVGGGGHLVWLTFVLGQTSAALEIKLGYVYLAVPISGLVISLYAFLEIGAIWLGEIEGTYASKDPQDKPPGIGETGSARSANNRDSFEIKPDDAEVVPPISQTGASSGESDRMGNERTDR